jgi:hypothetical protein
MLRADADLGTFHARILAADPARYTYSPAQNGLCRVDTLVTRVRLVAAGDRRRLGVHRETVPRYVRQADVASKPAKMHAGSPPPTRRRRCGRKLWQTGRAHRGPSAD